MHYRNIIKFILTRNYPSVKCLEWFIFRKV